MSPAVTVLVDAVGLALLHSVWQISLLAAALWLLLRILEGSSPQVRHGASVLALLLAPAAFVSTVVFAWDPVAVEGATLSALADVVQPARLAAPPVATSLPWQPVLVAVWGAGVVIFSLLFLGGLRQTRRLRTEGLLPIPNPLQAQADALAASLGIRRMVPVRGSRLVAVPQVIGALRPVILLPGVALTGLRPEQLEAILLHELAHVRRGDVWVGLLQGLVEIGLFFHPGVWWMSQRVRAERELCCDDVVAARVDPLGYARALLRLEEGRASHRAVAAAATDGSLKHRISRLVGIKEAPRRTSRSFAAVVLLGGLVVLPPGVAVAGDDAALQARVEAFAEMTISIENPDASRRRQDRSLRDDLLAMVDAYTELEAHIVALIEDDPERWAVAGPLRLAQAREAMGVRIRSSDIPSYLDAEQSAVYRQALTAKGNAQLATAEEAYELALSRAAERGLAGDLVDEARAGLASVRALQADAP